MPGALHFTHEDYGISIVSSQNFVVAKVCHIDEAGVLSKKHHTEKFYSEEGLKWALIRAKKARDEMLFLPGVQAYLASVYADPTGKVVTMSSAKEISGAKACKGLPGVFPSVMTKKLADGTEQSYLLIKTQVPLGIKSGYRTKSCFVSKYGLSEALRRVANWRAKMVGSEPPAEANIAKAEASLRRTYRGLIADTGKKRSSINSQFQP